MKEVGFLLLLSLVYQPKGFVAEGEVVSFQTGKFNISESFQDWSCSSACSPPQYCLLPRCTKIPFPETFSGSEKVRVHVSLSHGRNFSRVHSPAALWVQSVSTRGFEVCAREAGDGSNGTGIINWMAFQDQPQVTSGSKVFGGMWTTETKCDKVAFKKSFAARPFVFVSAKYTRATKPSDAVYVWLENVSSRSFEVCIKEFLPFDGKHQDTVVDWFAFVGNGSNFNLTMTGEVTFPNLGTPTSYDNFGFCQNIHYNTTFYASPVVLVSVHHYYNRNMKNVILPENNIVTAWVEEVGLKSMRICVRDLSGTGRKHDPLSVSYIVTGDLNPCLNVNCPSFGVCKTYSAHEARCVCFDDCPTYQDPVCTANGTTYDNKCWHELSYCRGLDNNLVYHPGSCEGFPVVRGRVDLHRIPKWTDSICQTVDLPPYRFYPDKKVHVQVTVNHMKLNDSVSVHDAVTSWTESVNTQNFTVCVMRTGRNSGENLKPFATVDWLAYQGAPSNGITGTIKMQNWWSGTKCEHVAFPKNKFKETPIVLVTAEHLRTGKEYDASLIWTEDPNKDSFKVCLREMQNFDGKHEDITVSWLVFDELSKPFFTEGDSVGFSNTKPPKDKDNNAYCQFLKFERSYNTTPSVILTANHNSTAPGNSAPVRNGIATWIENMNATGFKVCLKELYESRYDPVSVNYAVLADICDPGWSYFNGFCYLTSTKCVNWTTALTKCRQENSVLVDVTNDEENVYIQHSHNGQNSWLGLNDVSMEGNFSWADRGEGNFTAWAKNQPNNFNEEDCVHALGLKYDYEWNDVKCSDCHQYTCKKDFSECDSKTYNCHQLATCVNERGSYSCKCKTGYVGNGHSCRHQTPPRSCSEIRKSVSSSGNYVIDPDGLGRLAPFTVYCDMTDKNGVGVTVISHDSEKRTKVKGNSYSRDIHYTGASLSQLASLTSVSSHCEQFIKYECHHSVMFRWGVAWWVSRDSAKMTYWGGASPGSGRCACGMKNACADPRYVCNCDKNDAMWREDSGLLTEKKKLPVKQLRFGDAGGSIEMGYHTLGKLKCYGTP